MVPLWAGEGGLGNATLSLGALSRGPGAAHFPEGLPFCWPLTYWARDEAGGASAVRWGGVQSDPLLLLRTGCRSLHRLRRGSAPSPPSLSGASPPRPICNTNICPGEHSQGEINHRGAERVHLATLLHLFFAHQQPQWGWIYGFTLSSHTRISRGKASAQA